MICPYIVETVVVKTKEILPLKYQRVEVEDESGLPDVLHATANDSKAKEITKKYPMKCAGSDCAAWQGGHCARTH